MNAELESSMNRAAGDFGARLFFASVEAAAFGLE